MSPEELKTLLTSMAVTAEVVEAIDNPKLQTRRGWDLTGWNYVLVPWGVQFTHSAFHEEIDIRIEVFPERRGKTGEKVKLDCEACSSQGGNQRLREHQKVRR